VLLHTSQDRIDRLARRLVDAGWISTLQLPSVPADDVSTPVHRSRSSSVVDLTPAGRREAARRLLLPTGIALRHQGLQGHAPSTRRFFRHLAHTVGANAVFVAFVLAARRMSQRGFDEALEEWRCAPACARGRFRPDGHGCYRRGPWRFGFFLEYDRGTEKAREYAAKLDTYYRYSDSGLAARDFNSFPTLLVVSTSELAEARFAHQIYLAEQRHGGMPLAVFLTTTGRIRSTPMV